MTVFLLAVALATGILVILASKFGLPVSTTHVSVGALFGIGVTTRQADFRVMSGNFAFVVPDAAVRRRPQRNHLLLTHK